MPCQCRIGGTGGTACRVGPACLVTARAGGLVACLVALPAVSGAWWHAWGLPCRVGGLPCDQAKQVRRACRATRATWYKGQHNGT